VYLTRILRYIGELTMQIDIKTHDPSTDYDALLEVITSEGEDWKECRGSIKMHSSSPSPA